MQQNYLTWVLLLTVLGFICFYALTQQSIAFEQGHPYDAKDYFQMAEQSAAKQSFAAEKPFIYRVGLPYLIGRLFPGDILLGFKVANLCFATLVMFALYSLMRSYSISQTGIYIALLLYVTNPQAYFRFSLFFPVFTDPAALLAIIIIFRVNKLLSLNHFKKQCLISLLCFMGVFFREIVLIAPLTLSSVYVLNLLIDRKNPVQQIGSILSTTAPILAGFIGIIITHQIVNPVPGYYGFVSHALDSISRIIHSPDILLLATLMTFGPVILLIFVSLTKSRFLNFLNENKELSVYFLAILALSSFGGYHTDRIFFWSFPVVLTCIAFIFSEQLIRLSTWKGKLAFYIPLLIAQGFTFRLFTSIPNGNFDALFNPGKAKFLLFNPYGASVDFGQVYASYMNPQARLILLLQFAVLIIYLAVVLILNRARKS